MRRAVGPLLAVTVALVLADSAVVTLALPDILRHLDTTVAQVAWVLISFNLVLGLVAVPTAVGFARADPRILGAVGIAVFAGASAWCAVAQSIEVLIAARCVQALGGALALVGCLELLVAVYGERRGIAAWITAGVIGTATGPVAGGLLTQAFSWQAIFVVQVPIAVLAVPAALAVRAGPAPAPDPHAPVRHRPAVRPNLTLALLSAALTAALFLLVLLLVDGWRHSPATAALTVSVVPVAALAARPLARLLRPPAEVEIAVGCFLVAGGLVGLALLPSAELAWTVAPQALIGLGLGLTVDQLTSQAMHLRLPRVEHASWTISARHLGVVVGLAILTPVFVADLQEAQVPAQEAITVPRARRTVDGTGQGVPRPSARRRADGPAGSGARPAPRLRGGRLRARRPRRPRPGSSATSTTSWSAPRPGPSATRSSSAPAWRSSPCSPWSCPADGGPP